MLHLSKRCFVLVSIPLLIKIPNCFANISPLVRKAKLSEKNTEIFSQVLLAGQRSSRLD